MSLLNGKLNKELKLLGSVSALLCTRVNMLAPDLITYTWNEVMEKYNYSINGGCIQNKNFRTSLKDDNGFVSVPYRVIFRVIKILPLINTKYNSRVYPT